MPFDSFSAAGVAAIQMGIVDQKGFPKGATGTITPGTPLPLARMPFAKRFGGITPNPVRATAKGDNNRNRHEYIFNPNENGETAIMQHAFDMNQAAGMLAIKKVTDGNGYGIGVQTNAPVNAAQASVIVCVDAQEAGTTEFGFKKFINEIYPLVTITPLMANLQELAPADWSFFGIPTQASQLPWGTPFSLATHGFTRGAGYLLTSDYPVVLELFQAVGAETTINLTYTPATPMATYVLAWKYAGGIVTTFTPTSLAGKVLTVPALTAGDLISIRYEATDFLQTA